MIDYWDGCYDAGWKGIITDAAFAHPAKFSRGLIFRIIEHALADGLIQPGGVVLDPFGGVALGALPALMNGLSWVGCELEQKFVDMGRENIALWNSRFSGMPKWTGTAQLLQGDSRRLGEAVGAAGLVVGSPPYADTPIIDAPKASGGIGRQYRLGNRRPGASTDENGTRAEERYGHTPGQLGAMVVGSPPFAGSVGSDDPQKRGGLLVSDPKRAGDVNLTGSYGTSEGQLGAMIVGSPPYAESLKPETEEQTRRKQERIAKSKSLYDGRAIEVPSAGKAALGGGYGDAPGQLGAMPIGQALVVGSPPFENSLAGEPRKDNSILGQMQRGENKTNGGRFGKSLDQVYSSDPTNLGNDTGETFWTAARLIVEQCYLLLPPGGAAVWVVKDYVKNGAIVPFSEQWQALCEACGFETLHIHRAMLVKRRGAQAALDVRVGDEVLFTDMQGREWIQPGKELEDKSLDVSRKSFFRRLAEAKGSPEINWETVLCMVKR
jgi:hypothetical protein